MVTAALPDLVAPKYFTSPAWHDTLGAHVAAVSTLARFPPDPEQQLLLDAAFGIDKRGKSVAFEVCAIAPRQNLKTGFFKQYALGQLFVRHERLVVWSAHEFATADEALRDVEALIDGSDELRRQVKMTTRGDVAKHGAVPSIELLDGSRLIFKTRTSGGGRGLSGRKTILDEGYALQPGQVGALMPIMLAQPDPQICYGSSACRPESSVLWDVVQRGRSGDYPRMVYAEWCAPPPEEVCELGALCTHARGTKGCGCDKPELLLSVHSAITRGRIEVRSLTDMRTLPPAEYGREIMGWHDEIVDVGFVVDLSNWPNLEDDHAGMSTVSAFAVAVSPDRERGAIGAGGPSVTPGKVHLELTGTELGFDYRSGVEWVLPRCKDLNSKHPGAVFVLDDHGPAASLILDLRNAGLNVVGLTTDEAATATAQFVDGVKAGDYTHGPQTAVDDAIHGVRARPVGDGRFLLGRNASTVDICALEVMPLVAWAVKTGLGTPQVWSLTEMVSQIKAERAQSGAETGETKADSGPIQRADGSVFHRF